MRLIAFRGLGPEFDAAKATGAHVKADPFGTEALDATFELLGATQDRLTQEQADRYAGGNVKKNGEMCVSGEMRRIMDLELVEILRKHGMTAEADRYAALLAEEGSPKPRDYAGEELVRARRAGFTWWPFPCRAARARKVW